MSLSTPETFTEVAAAAGPGPRLAFARLDLRDALAVWRRHFEVYVRLWRTELAAPIIEPIFMLFAFGWGVGALVAAGAAGMPYLTFVGAGVLAFAALSRAVFECAYGSYFRMVYQSTFDAILATPIEAESLAFAEMCWATTKSTIDAFIILVILLLFGAAEAPTALLAPLPLALGAFFAAALTHGVTAHVHDIDSFNLYMSLYFSAVFLCGVWFPVELLPGWLQPVAWAVPLTSAIDLARACLVGRFLPRHLAEAAYLLAASLLLAEWAMRSLRRRMVS